METTQESVILSDTVQKMVEVVRTLKTAVADKSTTRADAYQMREAIKALSTLISNAVTG